MAENYGPSGLRDRLARADGGYRTYGMGVAMLYNPEETVHMHGRLIEGQGQEIADQAKSLMYLGLIDVIRFSHPQLALERGAQQTHLNLLRNDFNLLLPYMRRTVNRALANERYAEKMEIYCSDFINVKPAPMCVEGIYRNICASRPDQVTVGSLMMQIPLDERFSEGIENQPVQPFTETLAPPDLSDMTPEEHWVLEDLWRWGGKQDPGSN